MSIEGKNRRFMNIAKKIAQESGGPDYKHGAVLVRGGQVVNYSHNCLRPVNWANRFRNHQCGHATQHAELGAILGISRRKTTGSTIYVARIGSDGHFRLSKPCPMCLQVMEHVGIRKVVYTVNDEHVAEIKLTQGIDEEHFNYMPALRSAKRKEKKRNE